MEEKQIPNKAMLSLEADMAIDNLKHMLPHIYEQQVINAKILKAKFDSLVGEGFSEAQALEIVVKRPVIE